MARPNYMSAEAIEELREKLHHLKFVRRPEVSKAIETARAHGDLSENAEYDAAKEEQVKLERQISQLEMDLANARPLDQMDIPGDACYIGATVTLVDLEDDFEENYTLVSPPEADPRKGKLSVESPIGSGLLGKKEGEEVEIDIPAGIVRYRIESVER